MDTVGNRQARTEIAAIKVAAPERGAAGASTGRSRCTAAAASAEDFSLAAAYAHLRTLRLADGPDEVHKLSIARRELAPYVIPRGARRGAGLADGERAGY